MKYFKRLNPMFSYKLGFAISKYSGFMFYSIKFHSDCFEFYQKFSDYLVFVASFSYSVFCLFSIHQDSMFMIKSTILQIGLKVLIYSSVVTIVLTKFINMFWARKAFNPMKMILETEKKVKKFTFLSHLFNLISS